jgi:hypothetical protein
MSEETVTFNLELNVEPVEDSFRRVESLLFRTLGLLRRISGNENVDKAISAIQRLVGIIRLAHSAWIAFQAATGPIGWAFAIVAGLSAAASASDFMMSAGN